MQEEKEKGKFWKKIKRVLFVDDDELDDNDDNYLPDYETKEEIVEPKKEEVKVEQVINETPKEEIKEKEVKIPEEVEEAKEELPDYSEKASPFLSFDEIEFERLINSRVTKEDTRVKEEVVEEKHSLYNLPPSSRETTYTKNTLSSVSNTSNPGKKPFKPSPVISPVYGILDKNYSKEDIVDKRTDRKAELDNLDRIRKKAYGDKKEEIEETPEAIKESIDDKLDDLNFEEVKVSKSKIKIPKEEPKEENKISIEEDDDITYKTANRYTEPVQEEIEEPVENETEPIKESSPLEEELNNMIENDYEDDLISEDSEKTHAKMDDLEKTSTLRILDDIEKELNSIKPTSEEKKEKNEQIDENDIFNMISSMYVGGDDEDDRD